MKNKKAAQKEAPRGSEENPMAWEELVQWAEAKLREMGKHDLARTFRQDIERMLREALAEDAAEADRRPQKARKEPKP